MKNLRFKKTKNTSNPEEVPSFSAKTSQFIGFKNCCIFHYVKLNKEVASY